MALLKNGVQELLNDFTENTKDPASFLVIQPKIEENIKVLLKQCYDSAKSLEDRSKAPTFTLPKLHIKKFDVEQIWQQIELQNKYVCDQFDSEVQTLFSNFQPAAEVENSTATDIKSVPANDSSDDEEKEDEVSNEEDEVSNEEDENDTEEDEADLNKDDDEEGEDEIESNKVDGDIDEVNDKSNNNSQKVIFGDVSESYDDEIKSSFEKRQKQLKERVEKLEDGLLAEKPWQLKGEITAKKRPINSLLEQVLDFDLSSRPAPIITEKAALKLEDVIKNRIINRVWDDVERKIKPIDTPREFKKKLVLDQEKSKLSLAQVYEQDYLKQRESINPDNKNKTEEEPKEHKHLRVLLDSLFRKLDALSNYHYTPLPPIPELQIVTNLPAVALEEAIPDATSTVTLLAPEEVQGKVKGDLLGKEERTNTDKKRARRKKKIKQKLKQKEIKSKEKILEQMTPGMKNKFAKEKVKKDLEKLMKDKSVSHFKEDVVNTKSSKSSQQFFTRLQDTVTSDDKNKNKRKKDSISIDPKRIKL